MLEMGTIDKNNKDTTTIRQTKDIETVLMMDQD